MHSFLASEFLPKWSAFTAEAIEPSIHHALAEAQENIERIAAQKPAETTYQSSFLALESATESLSLGWGRLQHLDSVCDNPAQREAINKLLPDVTDFYSSLSLNPRLFHVLDTVAKCDAASTGEPRVRESFQHLPVIISLDIFESRRRKGHGLSPRRRKLSNLRPAGHDVTPTVTTTP